MFSAHIHTNKSTFYRRAQREAVRLCCQLAGHHTSCWPLSCSVLQHVCVLIWLFSMWLQSVDGCVVFSVCCSSPFIRFCPPEFYVSLHATSSLALLSFIFLMLLVFLVHLLFCLVPVMSLQSFPVFSCLVCLCLWASLIFTAFSSVLLCLFTLSDFFFFANVLLSSSTLSSCVLLCVVWFLTPLDLQYCLLRCVLPHWLFHLCRIFFLLSVIFSVVFYRCLLFFLCLSFCPLDFLVIFSVVSFDPPLFFLFLFGHVLALTSCICHLSLFRVVSVFVSRRLCFSSSCLHSSLFDWTPCLL